jgi:hypothetical protein
MVSVKLLYQVKISDKDELVIYFIRPVLSREERFLAKSSGFGVELAKIGQLPGRGPNLINLENLKRSAEQVLAEKVSENKNKEMF